MTEYYRPYHGCGPSCTKAFIDRGGLCDIF